LEKIAPPVLRGNPSALCGALADRLFNAPLQPAERERFVAYLRERGSKSDDSTLRDLLHLMMSTPEYQLT
jgi:hypothetical protein